ncbi:MAG TPA: alpha/beta hydrolase [Candidatus Nitrosopolaris sp.]
MIQKAQVSILLCLSIAIITILASSTYFGVANSQQNKTLIQPQGSQGMSSNATNIILVHGGWADGSSWSKVITILKDAGHKVIAVNMPLHNLADDVATVKRAVELVGKPVILVGHSYGGEVITNAGYNNPNVTGLVYIAAFAPDEGQSLSNFVSPKDFPQGFLMLDSAGLAYINPAMFHDRFAQDVDPTEAYIMAVAQKPFNASTFADKSGPPAWKQLPTWYQISTSDLMIPPDAQQKFAKQMNATTISINASHASYVSHPDEIAKLILDAAKGKTTQ